MRHRDQPTRGRLLIQNICTAARNAHLHSLDLLAPLARLVRTLLVLLGSSPLRWIFTLATVLAPTNLPEVHKRGGRHGSERKLRLNYFNRTVPPAEVYCRQATANTLSTHLGCSRATRQAASTAGATAASSGRWAPSRRESHDWFTQAAPPMRLGGQPRSRRQCT